MSGYVFWEVWSVQYIIAFPLHRWSQCLKMDSFSATITCMHQTPFPRRGSIFHDDILLFFRTTLSFHLISYWFPSLQYCSLRCTVQLLHSQSSSYTCRSSYVECACFVTHGAVVGWVCMMLSRWEFVGHKLHTCIQLIHMHMHANIFEVNYSSSLEQEMRVHVL